MSYRQINLSRSSTNQYKKQFSTELSLKKKFTKRKVVPLLYVIEEHVVLESNKQLRAFILKRVIEYILV